jgi:hypothetical protein
MTDLIDFYTKIVYESPCLITKIPIEYRTNEFYKTILMHSDHYFSFIPYEEKTQELCNFVFENGFTLIDYVPTKYRFEVYKKIVSKRGKSIEYVPLSYMTNELCEIAIDNGASINDIPKNYRTKELFIKIFKRENPVFDIFHLVPIDLRNDILEYIIKEQPEKFKYICMVFISKEFYDEKIKPNKSLYDSLTNDYKEYFENYPVESVDIKDVYINENGEFCIKGKAYKTYNCKNEMFNNIKDITNLCDAFYLKYCKKWTQPSTIFNIINEWLSEDGMRLQFIKPESRTPEMKLIAVSQNKDAIKFT